MFVWVCLNISGLNILCCTCYLRPPNTEIGFLEECRIYLKLFSILLLKHPSFHLIFICIWQQQAIQLSKRATVKSMHENMCKCCFDEVSLRSYFANVPCWLPSELLFLQPERLKEVPVCISYSLNNVVKRGQRKWCAAFNTFCDLFIYFTFIWWVLSVANEPLAHYPLAGISSD